MLEFQREILEEFLEDDCLVIGFKGLDLERILIEFLKCYNSKSSLVLVIGASQKEQDFIIPRLREDESSVVKMITSEYAVNERKKIYLEGGVLFITSRILIVDMLLGRVPFNLIFGLVVCKAHKIVDSCQEAFICRLYRINNKTGFIKGLSKESAAFTHGFGKIERIMRHLFVQKLYLWPRFHASINASLESRAKPEVIEVRTTLSEYMKSIQFAILELISMSLKEMAKANITLICDIDQLTAEDAISSDFDKYLKNKFEPVWHQLSFQTKKMFDDVKLLRRLLFSLTDDDCLTFYLITKYIRESIKIDEKTSDWIFWEPSEILFVTAKQRLSRILANYDCLNSEVNPKWISFLSIIKEIQEEVKFHENLVNVLIVVNQDKTIVKLNQILEKGIQHVFQEIIERSKSLLGNANDKVSNDQNKKRKATNDMDEVPLEPEPESINVNFSQEIKIESNLKIIYHSLTEGDLSFEQMLETHKPWYFILYDPNMEVIRRLEIYQALKCSPEQVKIYFFMYDGSAEEQLYLTNLRKEKEAFELLIKDKASMVIPENRSGKNDDHPDLASINTSQNEVCSREAGGQISRNQLIEHSIIIDMREFRSSLPSMIHRRGINIIPFTIEIGDYILTPETCVERKSISDLIGSLNSGRLFNQSAIMTRQYKRSILLIEFDFHKSFNFKGKYWGLGFTKSDQNLYSKLILLTTQFPQLRLIWSPSPQFSAEVFEYLKQGKEEPDPKKIQTSSEEQLPADYYTEKYDIGAKNFLLCLPGINLNNVYAVMNKVKCISELCDQSQDQLEQILESKENANALYQTFHSNLIALTVSDQKVVPKKSVFKKLKR